MPKETFFNLEPKKRELIVEKALEEFAKHPYEQASLSRIVENSGIAKGSMYQYFSDKLAFYLYIVELAYEKKRSYVKKAFAHKGGIFKILEEYYHQSYLFSQDYPLMHRVANNFWESRAQKLHLQLVEGKVARAQDFHRFLKEAITKGQVNPSLNPEAVFFVYHAVGKDLIDHFGDQINGEFVSQVLDVLRYGLQMREEEQ